MAAVVRRFSFLLLLVVPSAGLAQVRPDTTVALPGVTITATRAEATVGTAPARVTLLGRDAIDAAGAQTVAGLLEARSGAFVRAYGAGGLASLSLRGTGASQTLVLLDGHRIADPQLGQLDLSLLPTILLASVEVVHGAGSALYGTDAVGGVVNLRSAAPGESQEVRAMGTVGAYGERQGSLMLSGRQGALAGRVAADYAVASGDFPYVNASLFPPREVRREGADRARVALYATLAYGAGRHRSSIAGWYGDAERGLPGPGTTPPRGERQWDEHLRLWGDHHVRFAWGTLRLGGLYQQAALRYRNPQLHLDDTGRTHLGSAEMEAEGALGAHWLLGGGLAVGYGQARHPDLQADAAERHVAAFTHLAADYGGIRLYPALRFDRYAPTGASARSVLSPRLGINVQLLPGQAWYLKASAGRAFRMPTFNDRFWQPGGRADLAPEQGWTFDGGLFVKQEGQRGTWQAEVSLFTHRLRDQIVWQPDATGTWSPGNVSRVRTQGVEASVEALRRLGRASRLEGGAFYTFTDARDRSDPASRTYDHQLRYVPRGQLKGYVGLGWRLLRLDLSGRYTGRRNVTTDGSQQLGALTVFDAQLRLTGRVAHAHVTLATRLENVLDRPYEVVKGYPMPPRSLQLRLLVQFPGGQ